MSLMGTLAKVAIGYAAARGVDSLSRSRGGMPGQFGGAQVPADEARAEQAPGMGSLQDMIGQMASGAVSGMGRAGGAAGAARRPPSAVAWRRPRSVSGTSPRPWKRPSASQVESPWRTRTRRVGAVTPGGRG